MMEILYWVTFAGAVIISIVNAQLWPKEEDEYEEN